MKFPAPPTAIAWAALSGSGANIENFRRFGGSGLSMMPGPNGLSWCGGFESEIRPERCPNSFGFAAAEPRSMPRRGPDDRQKVRGLDACAADESAVNIGNAEDFRSISGLHGSPVEDANFGSVGAEPGRQQSPHGLMHLGDFRRARCFSGPYRPDRDRKSTRLN